jgi:hypothetical protein
MIDATLQSAGSGEAFVVLQVLEAVNRTRLYAKKMECREEYGAVNKGFNLLRIQQWYRGYIVARDTNEKLVTQWRMENIVFGRKNP